MEPYTKHLIFGGQSHGLSSACTARRIQKCLTLKVNNQSAPRYSAQFLVPSKLQAMLANMATMLLENFDLPAESQGSLQMELDRWVVRWSRTVGENPTDILGTLDNTVEILYPNIYKELIILLTMPVSTTTAERSFSATHRSTMHQQIDWIGPFTVDMNKAVDMFARKNLEHGI